MTGAPLLPDFGKQHPLSLSKGGYFARSQMRTNIPPSPPPETPDPRRGRPQEKSKSTHLPHRSHARAAAIPYKSATSHPIAADETPKNSALRAESKWLSKPLGLRLILVSPPRSRFLRPGRIWGDGNSRKLAAQQSNQICTSAGSIRPRDAAPAAVSRSNTSRLYASDDLPSLSSYLPPVSGPFGSPSVAEPSKRWIRPPAPGEFAHIFSAIRGQMTWCTPLNPKTFISGKASSADQASWATR